MEKYCLETYWLNSEWFLERRTCLQGHGQEVMLLLLFCQVLNLFFSEKTWALTNFSLVQRFLAACLTLNTVLFLLAFQHEFEVCGGGGVSQQVPTGL